LPRPPKDDTRSVYDKALGLLARREHSERELKTKLAQRGHAKDEAAVAVDRLKDQTYQSDQRFAGSLARKRAGQGYGPRRIQAELKSHALADAGIREALTTVDTDWTKLAAEQLRRRYGGRAPADAAERAKRAQFLLRRGFDAATVRAVTRAEVDDPGQDFD
jgi:regulatory protein